MAKPTIGHVLHRLDLAGAEVLAAALARKLSTAYRFVFLCLDGTGPQAEGLERDGFRVVNLERRPGIDLRVARRIRHAAGMHRIDLLHAHQYTPFFYAAMSRYWQSRPRILFTEHGRHYPDFRRPKRVIANRVLIKSTDRVTAVGEFVRKMVVRNEGIPADRIQVIYNGIDPAQFPAGQVSSRDEARQLLDIPPGCPAIMQVARFHPVKDHETALRAFADVVKEMNSAILLLVGEGERRHACETLADELGIPDDNVRFTGLRNDISRILPAADVFMLSSLSEGISVTLLEAMACSLPIVATDVGGNGEVVRHGETGLLSPRGDHVALSRHLVTLLRDEPRRIQMGEAGRKRLLETFTQDRMHSRYAEIYEQMLTAGRGYKSY